MCILGCRSLLAFYDLYGHRQTALEAEMVKEKAKHAPLGTLPSSLLQAPWTESAVVPRIEEENEKLRTRADRLAGLVEKGTPTMLHISPHIS